MERPFRILPTPLILFSRTPLWSGPLGRQIAIVRDTKEDSAPKTVAGFKAGDGRRLPHAEAPTASRKETSGWASPSPPDSSVRPHRVYTHFSGSCVGR